MQRLIIVSNRLPVEAIVRGENIDFKQSVGGVATGLNSLKQLYERIWIGWPGGAVKPGIKGEKKKKIYNKLASIGCRPVLLSEQDIEDYYQGFCNQTIWSNFHYFLRYTVHKKEYWAAFKRANARFCEEVKKVYRPGDLIWIHDYQLMLLPEMAREAIPEATIGYFLHIPFPAYETFSALPWRYELLKGMLGADLVGFHAYHYAENFLNSVRRIAGYEHSMNQLFVSNRIVEVDSFPMGINYEKFHDSAKNKKVQAEVKKLKKSTGRKKIIISIDRLDYTKGIPERIEAFGEFLENNPEYRGKAVLILVAVPSRTKVPQYEMLKKEIDETLSRVNGKYGAIGWTPILYFYRSFPFENLAALYKAADAALITPLRDGMNLVAKEYVAVKSSGRGVLILSEKAGSASELGESIIVNPFNKFEIAASIKTALEMKPAEQAERNTIMQKRLKRYDVERWANDFINAMNKVKKEQERLRVKRIDKKTEIKIIKEYRKAKKRLIVLDYDGTLRSFVDNPEAAGPEQESLGIIKKLLKDPKNRVVIVSGRKKKTLQKWFGGLKNINLIGEHGIWIKEAGSKWRMIEPLKSGWKDDIRPVLELYVDRTPGSFIEEKDFSLVWHFRKAEAPLGELRARELKDAMLNLTANLNLGILSGSGVVEIKSMGVNKGRAVLPFIKSEKWDIIITAGDDWTDEDTFETMPPGAYSIKVGFGYTKARYDVESVTKMRNLLKKLMR